MQKENDTENAVAEEVTAPEAAPAETPTAPEPEKGSLRESLERAMESVKSEEPEPVKKAEPAPVKQEPPPLQPPAEYDKEEQEDFRQSSRKAQEAALRLHKSRMRTLDELKERSRSVSHIEKLAQEIEPYVRATGMKEPATVAMQKAIAMYNQFNVDDPAKARAAAREYLRAKGIDPRAIIEDDSQNQAAAIPPELASTLRDVDVIKSRLAEEDRKRATDSLSSAWMGFESIKNAAGKPKYPDLGDTESGLRLASSIGSLVSGVTDLSKQFIANAQSRIPGLTYDRLLEEAYRFHGGKVDDSAAPTRTQSTQSHLTNSRRAASSVPGRSAGSSSSGPVRKFKSTREAAEAALAQLRDD